MQDIYKNPMTYYLAAPILAAVWPALVVFWYLPAARDSMEKERALCIEGQTYILDILKYDPKRLDFSPDKSVSGEFSFDKAIDRVANLCSIRSANCDYTSGGIAGTDKESQNAKVTLKAVGIVQAATFLSYIQSMWVGLKCDQVKLTKKEGVPDQWDAEMKFRYSY
ncbi:MAG: hypothetical protein JW955_17710 [Sedimentisphaerales bacterium]|nr:hypothetical protein [Sedimentisphaerales bacterium]